MSGFITHREQRERRWADDPEYRNGYYGDAQSDGPASLDYDDGYTAGWRSAAVEIDRLSRVWSFSMFVMIAVIVIAAFLIFTSR